MNRTILNKATSADAAPTPGYLYDEIAKVTHDPLGNERLVEYLLKRIESPSPDVKAKVLNIIKQVCRKGNPSFRKALQRDGANAIKALLKFHCAADPLRGDEPSRRVREYAQEACNAIFDSSKDERNLANQAVANRIQGFGAEQAFAAPQYQHQAQQASHTSSAAAPSSYQPQSRYTGIGNPAFALPNAQASQMDVVGGMLGRVTNMVREKFDRSAASNAPPPPPPFPTFANSSAPPPGDYSFASNRMQAYQQQGYDPQETRRSTSAAMPQQQQHAPRSGGHGSGGAAAAVEGYELQLIEELTSPTGIKPVPPKDKLEVFCSACKSALNAHAIVDRLNAKLSEENEKVQRKALSVVERMLAEPELLDRFGDLFDAEIDALERLFHSPSAPVRQQVAKVWKMLYEEEGEGGAQQASATTTDNLLDFATPSPPPPPVMDMFQNMTIKAAAAPPPPAAPAAPSSGFGFLSAPVQQTTSHKPAPAINLLDSDDFFSLAPVTATSAMPINSIAFPPPLVAAAAAPPPATAPVQKKPATDSFNFVQDALAAGKRNF